MKKLSLLLLGLIGISFSLTSVAFAQSNEIPFDDHEDHIYEEAIEYLFAEGIIDGYPDNTFKPNKTIKRSELLKIIVASNYYQSEYEQFAGTSCFPDVPANEWFTQYVCFAKEKGIVEGYEDGNFRPAQEVNLVESLKMIYEGIGMVVNNPNATFKFKYYSPAMRAGYIPEDLVGGFGDIVTRGEISEIIYRILNDEDKELKSKVYLALTVYKQKYKASCGTAALATALSQELYVTEDEVIDEMITMGLYPNNELINEDGVYKWDDPQKVFVGDYNGTASIYMTKLSGFGFLEGPLEQLSQKWALNSEKFTGENLSFISAQLEEGYPVIVFANVNARDGEVILTEPGPYNISWEIKYDGRVFEAPMYKHNLVVEGYEGTPENPETFYIADPFYGKKFEMTQTQLDNILKGYNYSGVVVKF